MHQFDASNYCFFKGELHTHYLFWKYFLMFNILFLLLLDNIALFQLWHWSYGCYLLLRIPCMQYLLLLNEHEWNEEIQLKCPFPVVSSQNHSVGLSFSFLYSSIKTESFFFSSSKTRGLFCGYSFLSPLRKYTHLHIVLYIKKIFKR